MKIIKLFDTTHLWRDMPIDRSLTDLANVLQFNYKKLDVIKLAELEDVPITMEELQDIFYNAIHNDELAVAMAQGIVRVMLPDAYDDVQVYIDTPGGPIKLLHLGKAYDVVEKDSKNRPLLIRTANMAIYTMMVTIRHITDELVNHMDNTVVLDAVRILSPNIVLVSWYHPID